MSGDGLMPSSIMGVLAAGPRLDTAYCNPKDVLERRVTTGDSGPWLRVIAIDASPVVTAAGQLPGAGSVVQRTSSDTSDAAHDVIEVP